jgi:hypothetical protein
MKDVNLISISLAEVFVFHKQLRLPGHEALNATHPALRGNTLAILKIANTINMFKKTKFLKGKLQKPMGYGNYRKITNNQSCNHRSWESHKKCIFQNHLNLMTLKYSAR